MSSSSSSSSTALPHIFHLGATGRVGKSLLSQALSQGYTVTALARDPAKLSNFTSSTNLNVLKGSPTFPTDLHHALTNALEFSETRNRNMIIISTLGQTRLTSSPFSKPTSPPLYMTTSITALLSVLSELPITSRLRVKKLIVLSMFGTGSSYANLHCTIKPVMRYSWMTQTVEDHNGVDEVVRGQREGLNWVMARPSMLKEGSAEEDEVKAVVVRNDDGTGEGWLPSSILVSSVVSFLLECVTSSKWDGRSPVIVN